MQTVATRFPRDFHRNRFLLLIGPLFLAFSLTAGLQAQSLQLGSSYNHFVVQGMGAKTLNLILTECGSNVCWLEGNAYGAGAIQSSGTFMLIAAGGTSLKLADIGTNVYSVSQSTGWWLLYQSSAGSLAGELKLQQVNDSPTASQATATGTLSGLSGSLAPAMNAAAVSFSLRFSDGGGLQKLLDNTGSLTSQLAAGSSTGSAVAVPAVAASASSSSLVLGSSYDKFGIQGQGGNTVGVNLTDCGGNTCMLDGGAYATGAMQSSGKFVLIGLGGAGLKLSSLGNNSYSVSQPTAWWLLYSSSAGTLAGELRLQQVADTPASGQAVATGVFSSLTGSLAPEMNAGAVSFSLRFYDGGGLQKLLGNSNSFESSLVAGSSSGTAVTSTSTSTTSSTTASSTVGGSLTLGASYDHFMLRGQGGNSLLFILTDCSGSACKLDGGAYGAGALQSSGYFTLTGSSGGNLTLTSTGTNSYSVSQPAAWSLLYQSSAGTLSGELLLQQVADTPGSGQAVATGVLSSLSGSLAPAMHATEVSFSLRFYDGGGLQKLLGNTGSLTLALAPGSSTGGALSSTTTSSSTSTISSTSTTLGSGFDSYGGLVNITPAGVTATGFFQVKKIGSRWVFIDPDGHPYWMIGVYDVDLNTDTSAGQTYVLNKYGSRASWGLQAVRRLKSWGFTSTGEYASAYVVPVDKDGSYETSDPMPWVDMFNPAYYSLIDYGNYAPQPVKNLVNGMDSEYKNYDSDRLPDVFDPNFQTYADAFAKASTSAAEADSPWLVGTAMGDLDDLWGFGSGPDVPTTRYSSNLGWFVLCTDFQQLSNSALKKTYSDPKVYSKYALASWLQSKYGTIAALNAAWGSNYTTFGDSGGYGTGTGLLDEDGRHAWVGNDDVSMSTATPQVRADLNAFLGVFAQKYFSIVAAAIRAARPHQLVFGPCTLNNWNGVSRQPILAAAAKYADVIQASMGSQQVYDLSLKYAGDKPFVTETGFPANPDSDLSSYANPYIPDASSSQSTRGQAYAAQLLQEFQFTGSSAAGSLQGSQNVVGSKWWAWEDNWGEKTNWGLVTFLDNAYDGKQDVIAAGIDPWGYPTGGEAANHGDFIDSARQANFNLLNDLASSVK